MNKKHGIKIKALEKGKWIHHLSPNNITPVDESGYKIIDSSALKEILSCNGEKTGRVEIRYKKNGHSTVLLHPAGNYMFKVNNRNTRTRCEICSKLTIKTSEQNQ